MSKRISGELKKEDGVIIIEACLTIPMFMFVILTILAFILPCIGQAKMAIALNEASFDYSQSYYMNEHFQDDLQKKIDKFMLGIVGGGSSDNIPGNEKYSTANLSPIADAPAIAENLVYKHFGTGGAGDKNSISAAMKKYGITDLDFSLSRYETKTNTMIFIANYKVTPLSWPYFKAMTFNIQQRSMSRLWRRDG
ncbi:hypothetical protein FACS1894125_1540 [Actinomycetota bacterium]|nr:hypothetical protein FACS1894125_1540 [Actinomycetota bacterium]